MGLRKGEGGGDKSTVSLRNQFVLGKGGRGGGGGGGRGWCCSLVCFGVHLGGGVISF